MPLQRRSLVLSALTVVNNVPPNKIQGRLPDGIHLRWSFAREQGFPWFGYYLFRRSSSSADRVLQRVDFDALPPAGASGTVITTPAGELSSDAPIALTQDFPPPGRPELDLDGRGYLRFVPADLASLVRVDIGFRQDAEIEVTGYLERVPVTRQRVRGTAGAVVTVELRYDALSEVDLGPGPAAVVDLGSLAVSGNATAGWQPLPGFPSKAAAAYPLCLPVAHPDYPCLGASATAADAAVLGTARVRYGLPTGWSPVEQARLHSVLSALVAGGPAGPPMAAKASAVPPTPADPQLRMPAQAPLDLVLLGALHTGLAQLVGLAWVDETVMGAPGTSFDYLLVADHDGRLGGTAAGALQYLRAHGFGDVDAFIVFDRRITDPAPALDPPVGVQAYALPATPTQGVTTAAGGVGLTWDRGVTDLGALLPGRAVLYHLWRAELGTAADPAPPTGYPLHTTNGPILVAGPSAGTGMRPPPDWPPTRLHAVDGGLDEGWYGYQVSGVDIFGRHSANSTAAPWHQWTPPPDPLPWYYQPPPSDAIVHPSAVAVLDKVPPPHPPAVEAAVLDPDDPTLVTDAAHQAWRASLPASEQQLVGLRVSWSWTRRQQDQAPDTREFRVYFQPGRFNVRFGRTGTVTSAGASACAVSTDLPNDRPTGAWAGARLLFGTSAFRILGSDAGNPLVLRVANAGPAGDVRPPAHASCSVAIPEGHPLHVDHTMPHTWQTRLWVVGYAEHVTVDGDGNRRYDLFLPVAGDADRTGSPVAVSAAEPLTYGTIGVTAADDKRHTPDDPARTGRWGGAARYGNESQVGAPATVFRVYRGTPPAPQLPEYADDRLIASPANYHGTSFFTVRWVPSVGSRTHVLRALDRSLYQVDHRIRTTRGSLDPALDTHAPLFPAGWPAARRSAAAAALNTITAPADYEALSVDARELLANLPGNGQLGWTAGLPERDWFIRRTRTALDPDEADWFPAEWNSADPADVQHRQDVAAELNALDQPADYETLSSGALRVLAGLPGNEGAFAQLTTLPLDPDDPETADRRGPDSPATYQPDPWLRAYVDGIPGRSVSSYLYRLVNVNAVHTTGAASLATPPVAAPDVMPPRAPVVVKVLGGDRSVILRWASNREPDLAAYRVYRADAEADARDVRLMTLMYTRPVAAGARPGMVEWTDTPVPGLADRWYRLVAVDGAGNASEPSRPARARAYDESLPQVPPLTVAWTGAPPAAAVSWAATDDSCLEIRSAGTAVWTPVGGWRGPGVYQQTLPLDPARAWRFRLRARKATGAQSLGSTVELAPLP